MKCNSNQPFKSLLAENLFFSLGIAFQHLLLLLNVWKLKVHVN